MIKRERGIRKNPAFVQENVKFGSGGMMVYASISTDGGIDPHNIWNGARTSSRYRNEILRRTAVPYAAVIGYNFMLMDDNCRRHSANLKDGFLLEEGKVQMEWAAYSLDMNSIKHVWDNLGKRVLGHLSPLHTL